jgi:hypothetical protein
VSTSPTPPPTPAPETVSERLRDPRVQERLRRYLTEARALLGDAAQAALQADAERFWDATWQLLCVVAMARAAAEGPQGPGPGPTPAPGPDAP